MGTHSGVINMMSDSEYVKLAEEAWKEALEIARSSDEWKEEKKDKNTGDIVESRKNSAGRKIYRCKASIGMPAKLLIEAISNTDKVCEWNKTLTEARVLKTINKDCVISYQVRGPGQRTDQGTESPTSSPGDQRWWWRDGVGQGLRLRLQEGLRWSHLRDGRAECGVQGCSCQREDCESSQRAGLSVSDANLGQ